MFRMCLLLSVVPFAMGCTSSDADLLSSAPLEPAGWYDVESTYAHTNFPDYAKSVRSRLIAHRVDFDSNRSLQEVVWASPRETAISEACNGQARGIAILVHGLSDTAFAMSDLSGTMSRLCYVARTALLPGHGTRPGDLTIVDHRQWLDTVKYLARQAAAEHERVVLVGFSLGAVITMTAAIELPDAVDAIVAIGPAYNLSAYNMARLAPWIDWLVPWLDKDPADDPMRYESLPTRAVAETVRAIQLMHARIEVAGGFHRPWMMIQSLDDEVIAPTDNMAFIERHGEARRIKTVNFYSDTSPKEVRASDQWIHAVSDASGVQGLTHLATHISPENVHYGAAGGYRNCGATRGRAAEEVALCLASDSVVYRTWENLKEPKVPTALSSFNPHYPALEESIAAFLDTVN